MGPQSDFILTHVSLIAISVCLLLCVYISNKTIKELKKQHKEDLEKKDLLIEEANALASIDPLTKLANRRGLKMLLRQIYGRFRRKNVKNLFVCIIDLDFFKQVNDTFGHLVGDELLVYVSSLLKEKMRSADVVSRYGGDEFVLVCPDSKKENLVKILEEVSSMYKKYAQKLLDGRLQVGLTFGIVSTDSPTITFEELFFIADEIVNGIKKAPGGSRYKPPQE